MIVSECDSSAVDIIATIQTKYYPRWPSMARESAASTTASG